MASAADTKQLDLAELEKLAANPANKVYRYVESDERKEGALTATQLEDRFEALKRETVQLKTSCPEWTDFQIRLFLMRRDPEWKDFASVYPTFFQRATDTVAKRSAIIPLHAIIDVQKRLEAGEIDSQETADYMVRDDTMCFMLDKVDRQVKKGADKRLHEKARLRRRVLEKKFAACMVPSEELERANIVTVETRHEPDPMDDVIRRWKALKKNADANAAARERALKSVTGAEILLGRRLVALRMQVAERCMGPHPMLDPEGYSFIPTATRAGQLELRWLDDWIAI